jgi:hypothetical protein
MAEAVSCIVWVPTDVLKERAQANPSVTSSASSTIRSILRQDGLRGLYRGYGATLASFGPFSAFYFMFTERFKSQVKVVTGQTELTFPQLVGACAVSGGSAALITAPLDLIKVRMQVEMRQSGSRGDYGSLLTGLRHVLNREGWRGLFRGGSSRVWFAVPNTAITMSLMEYLLTINF